MRKIDKKRARAGWRDLERRNAMQKRYFRGYFNPDLPYTRSMDLWYARKSLRTTEFPQSWVHSKVNGRAMVADLIARHRTPANTVYVLHWGRDCDMCEGTSCYEIDASVSAYELECERCERSAEGPWTLAIISEREARKFEPECRDLALEAYEDGHPHVVYTGRTA